MPKIEFWRFRLKSDRALYRKVLNAGGLTEEEAGYISYMAEVQLYHWLYPRKLNSVQRKTLKQIRDDPGKENRWH